MSILDLFRRKPRQPRDRFLAAPVTYPEADTRTETMAALAPSYGAEIRKAADAFTNDPHGIATLETLQEILDRAHAEAEAAAAQPWGDWDQPGTGLGEVPAYEPLPPPPSPYSGVSRIMVGEIAYPDPSDLSYDKDRHYRETLRRIGVATGTSTTLEQTGVWPRIALEPGDGRGVPL